jgi:hypothetical protein
LISTLIFAPPLSLSPRPYPVMLLIGLQLEK